MSAILSSLQRPIPLGASHIQSALEPSSHWGGSPPSSSSSDAGETSEDSNSSVGSVEVEVKLSDTLDCPTTTSFVGISDIDLSADLLKAVFDKHAEGGRLGLHISNLPSGDVDRPQWKHQSWKGANTEQRVRYLVSSVAEHITVDNVGVNMHLSPLTSRPSSNHGPLSGTYAASRPPSHLLSRLPPLRHIFFILQWYSIHPRTSFRRLPSPITHSIVQPILHQYHYDLSLFLFTYPQNRPWQHPYPRGVAHPLACMGSSHSRDDPSGDVAPKAHRFETQVSLLHRSYSYVRTSPSLFSVLTDNCLPRFQVPGYATLKGYRRFTDGAQVLLEYLRGSY